MRSFSATIALVIFLLLQLGITWPIVALIIIWFFAMVTTAILRIMMKINDMERLGRR